MSFMLYVAGVLVVIAGVAWGMIKAGLAPTWVIIICIVVLGVGILTGVARTRSKDLPKAP